MRSSKITMNYWKSISQENQSAGKNLRGRNSSGFKTPPCSRSIMAAPKMALAFNRWWMRWQGCSNRLGNRGAPPYAAAFSRLSTPIAASGVSIYGYTAERCACGIRWPWPGEKSWKSQRCVFHPKGKLFGQTPLIRVKLLSFPATAWG